MASLEVRARAGVVVAWLAARRPREFSPSPMRSDRRHRRTLLRQAPGHTWYPHSFLAPPRSKRALSLALACSHGQAVAELEKSGLPRERIMLLGFSQGGCLALEYAARNAGKYAGVVGLSAGPHRTAGNGS